MSDQMAALDAAYAEVRRAEALAEEIVNAAWLDLGRVIRAVRAQGTKQADIARHFDMAPEHIRRIQEDADVADGLKSRPARKTRPAPSEDLAAIIALTKALRRHVDIGRLNPELASLEAFTKAPKLDVPHEES